VLFRNADLKIALINDNKRFKCDWVKNQKKNFIGSR
jgi:hypothetical protein